MYLQKRKDQGPEALVVEDQDLEIKSLGGNPEKEDVPGQEEVGNVRHLQET